MIWKTGTLIRITHSALIQGDRARLCGKLSCKTFGGWLISIFILFPQLLIFEWMLTLLFQENHEVQLMPVDKSEYTFGMLFLWNIFERWKSCLVRVTIFDKIIILSESILWSGNRDHWYEAHPLSLNEIAPEHSSLCATIVDYNNNPTRQKC